MNTRKFYFCHTAKLSALLGGLMLLNGCSSAPKPQIAEVPNELSAQEFHDTMAEFEYMKPSLQRLAALEPELKALISQLTQIAEAAEIQEKREIAEATATQSVPEIAQVNQTMPIEPKPVKVPASNTNKSMASSNEHGTNNLSAKMNKHVEESEVAVSSKKTVKGQYTLQLTAVTDRKKLLDSWRTLQKTYSPELDDLQAIYQEIELSGVTFYRIKAGYYSSEQQAKKGCSSLKKLGANCIVSNNSGLSVI
jgi:hypothetical protein